MAEENSRQRPSEDRVTELAQARLECDAIVKAERDLRMQAEAGVLARDRFLSIMSHELRSPLNGIQSWTHVLEHRLGSEVLPGIERALDGIKTGVQQQVHMINDLVDAMQVLTGTLRLDKQVFSLRPVLESAAARVGKLAQERQVTLHEEYPVSEVSLFGSAERIEQVIEHLLLNGIKFNHPGGRVDIKVEPGEHDVGISIADDGKGIEADFMPFLFEPFRHSQENSNRRAEGLGLGLTLARRLSELHGGGVIVQSAGKDLGSVFTVRLPLNGEPQPASHADSGLHIV